MRTDGEEKSFSLIFNHPKHKFMQKLLKQAIGIDIAKDDFAVSYGNFYHDSEVKIITSQVFKNKEQDFARFDKLIKKLVVNDVPLSIVMEATGVYHEKLASFLYEKGYPVSVVLPQRAKTFMKTLKTKTLTDKEASKGLTVMGLEKKLDLWQKPEKTFLKLRQLTREREQVQDLLTQVKNQLHAQKAGAWPNDKSIARMNQLMRMYKKQIKDIEKEINEIVRLNSTLEKKIGYLISIPGVGLITAVTVIGETNGFNLIRNKKQLVSYAGYDIVSKESGSSVRGKPHISHRGNRHIRRGLHMPALASIRFDENSRDLFVRLVSKHGIKMKGVVAVQRKLLILMYTLWNKEEYYDARKYHYKKIEQPNRTALPELDQVRSLEFENSLQR